MSDSTRHHDVIAPERLQKFALEHRLVDKPVFAEMEKPRVGRRDRVPTAAETEAILARGSHEFRLIYSALRQCGARPGELPRAIGMLILDRFRFKYKTVEVTDDRMRIATPSDWERLKATYDSSSPEGQQHIRMLLVLQLFCDRMPTAEISSKLGQLTGASR
jgi:hypothetical protein